VWAVFSGRKFNEFAKFASVRQMRNIFNKDRINAGDFLAEKYDRENIFEHIRLLNLLPVKLTMATGILSSLNLMLPHRLLLFATGKLL